MIKVDGISKKYDLKKFRKDGGDTMYRSVINGIRDFGTWFSQRETEEFWALRDVSFEIEQGDRVGIIGRNGAGKSTLLKILSRITPPTKGSIEINGRVASLLEVGTGFHGDLSGRENIYLNGSILGMSRQEINQKFDEIVAFAEVEKFLDTPVKRYSSGMYVRLAFAIAAHLDSDVLIVDEVLAVGDAAFQKKCLGKMNDISKNNGRTILFVSHQINTIQALCNKGLVLHHGEVSHGVDVADKAIKHYMSLANQVSQSPLAERRDRVGEGNIKVTAISFYSAEGLALEELMTGQEVTIKVSFECLSQYVAHSVNLALAIYGDDGVLYTVLNSEHTGNTYDNLNSSGNFVCNIKKLPLMEGTYFFNVSISEKSVTQDWVQEAVFINVTAGDYYGTGRINPNSHRSVLIENTWS